jgi:hypothetical protein
MTAFLSFRVLRVIPVLHSVVDEGYGILGYGAAKTAIENRQSTRHQFPEKDNLQYHYT